MDNTHLPLYELVAVRMARRRGLGAINKEKLEKAKYGEKGAQIADVEISHVSTQIESFRAYLEAFAAKHKTEIKKNPEFRAQFQQMCARIGVDPLASSKGFWASLLGVGDFYYEVGIQIIEICLATRDINGGLITLEELRKRVIESRSKTQQQDVSLDDLTRAIKKLSILGNGFKIIPLGGKKLVQSVPGELNMDHTTTMQQAESTGYTCVSTLTSAPLKWSPERASHVLEHLIKEGMVWIDKQAPETRYYFPSLFFDIQTKI